MVRSKKKWVWAVAGVSLIAAMLVCRPDASTPPVATSVASQTPKPRISIAKSTDESARVSVPTRQLRTAPRCAQDIGPFTPTRLVIEQVGIDAPIAALPLLGTGALPVPLTDLATSGAWWKDGAVPGSGKGSVYIGAHTYSKGVDAVGNKILRITAGAVAKLYDASGVVGACYVLSDVVGVAPDSAPPIDSWRLDGYSTLALMTCGDYDPVKKVFNQRVFHYWSRIW